MSLVAIVVSSAPRKLAAERWEGIFMWTRSKRCKQLGESDVIFCGSFTCVLHLHALSQRQHYTSILTSFPLFGIREDDK